MPDRTVSAEIGSVVSLEHVNLRVPDHRLATLFFIEGLGLTRDPYRMVGTRNMWVNVGHQQFHLPIGPPSPLPGEVGLIVPEPSAVARQLAAIEPELADTAFAWTAEGDGLRVTSPWGHRIRVDGPASHPVPLALRDVEFWVAPGTAEGIGAFYEEVLQCPVQPGRGDGGAVIEVTVGPHQTLRFRERPEGGTVPNTSHVAIYVTRYRTIYAALHKRGLIYEEDAGEQFRFCDIVDPASGRRLFVFEHEVRSLHHPGYRRPLVNRIALPREVD